MITYNTTWVCEACMGYVPMNGYSLQPDTHPLIINSVCPVCTKPYTFSIGENGEISIEGP